MQKQVKTRLISILIIFLCSAAGVFIILANLNDNIVFFYPPSEMHKILAKQEKDSTMKKIRVGGLVKEGSIKKIDDKTIEFIIEDYEYELKISYSGILPALFREKQGIVAEGYLQSEELFIAKSLLAKHDENYTPPNKPNKID